MILAVSFVICPGSIPAMRSRQMSKPTQLVKHSCSKSTRSSTGLREDGRNKETLHALTDRPGKVLQDWAAGILQKGYAITVLVVQGSIDTRAGDRSLFSGALYVGPLLWDVGLRR
jgi:hypothetical protein